MIRPAEPADYPALSSIQHRALEDPWPEMLELGVAGPPLVLVAETDRPVGYALVVAGDGVAYLAELAVDPAEQGRGYGSNLMDALLERLEADGADAVRLTARADADRVHAFYEQFGFEGVETVPDHYADGGDGLVMARPL